MKNLLYICTVFAALIGMYVLTRDGLIWIQGNTMRLDMKLRKYVE